jgi:hypothetical protein
MCEFHSRAQGSIPKPGFDGHHMRPVNELAFASTEQGIEKTSNPCPRHGPEYRAAVFLSNRDHFAAHAHGAPYIFLNAFALPKFFNALEPPHDQLCHRFTAEVLKDLEAQTAGSL